MAVHRTVIRGEPVVHRGHTIVPVARSIALGGRLGRLALGWTHTGPLRIEVDGQRHRLVDWVLVARMAVAVLVLARLTRRI